MSRVNDIEALNVAASDLIDEGKYAEAETLLRKAVAKNPSPQVLNNLAVCRLEQGDPEDALHVLQPNLTLGVPVPFTRSIAAEAHFAAGRVGEAKAELDNAVRDFEAGLFKARTLGRDAASEWYQYTVELKRAAGTLGLHREVLDLYRRHEPHHTTPEDRFLAGVAEFNLGRFNRAVSHWSKLPMPTWGFAQSYIDTARMVDLGVVPAFPLEYASPPPGGIDEHSSEEIIVELSSRGWYRMTMLSYLLTYEFTGGQLAAPVWFLRVFAKADSEWGLQLVRNLLMYAGASRLLKGASIQVLTEYGELALGQEIDVVEPDGTIAKMAGACQTVSFETSPDVVSEIDAALELAKAKKWDEALDRLAPLTRGEMCYVDALLATGAVLLYKGDHDEALDMFQKVYQILPDHPLVLYRLAETHFHMGNFGESRRYLDQVDLQEDDSAPLRKAAADMYRALDAEANWPFGRAAYWENTYRQDQVHKPISLKVKLSSALRRLPVPWLDAACRAHDPRLLTINRRKEREEALAAILTDEEHLAQFVKGMKPKEKRLLKLLLERDGWEDCYEAEETFGTTQNDGFWWDEELPPSTCGSVQASALAMVGAASILGMEDVPVLVIPMELRPLLTGILMRRPKKRS